ncbi:MAG: hypothetical protein QXX13_07495 [Candidatus Methanomethylicia archaeon]
MSSRNLLLLLGIDRDLFVRFESIVVHVSLVNNGLKPIAVEDLTATNNPLFFRAVNNFGGRFKGSLQSFWMRDGVGEVPVRGKSMITLNPKEAREIHVDLIKIFNVLPEGNYKVYAYYRLGTLSFLKSNIISFRIVKSKPIYSITFQDYARNNMIPIRTSWINEGEDGFYIFLMDCSYNLPSNIISNRRIAKINGLRDITYSIPSVYGQNVEHVLWVDNDTLYVAEIINGGLGNIRRIKRPIGYILNPPLTTEDGELRFLTFLEGLVKLVRIPFKGEVMVDDVLKLRGLLDKYSIVFDMDSNPYLVYNLDRKIYYLKINIYDQANIDRRVDLLAEANNPVLNLHLSNAWRYDEDSYRISLNYVVQENNKLCSYLIDVDNGKHLSHTYTPLEDMKLKLIQVILDYDYNPYFLLQDSLGTLWFKSYDGELIKATGEDERCPGNVSYPVMLISSKYSRKYGIYLRYVKNESTFTYRKLKRLID